MDKTWLSKEVAEVRKQKFTRGVFPLLLLGMILLFVFGCKGSDSSSVRIGFVGSNYSNHMDYEFSTFTGTESNKFKAQKGDLIRQRAKLLFSSLARHTAKRTGHD